MSEETLTSLTMRFVRMESELRHLNEGLKENSESIDKVMKKLDDFVEKADDRYAARREVKELREQIKMSNNNNREWIRWLVPLFISLILLLLEFGKYFVE